MVELKDLIKETIGLKDMVAQLSSEDKDLAREVYQRWEVGDLLIITEERKKEKQKALDMAKEIKSLKALLTSTKSQTNDEILGD